MAFVLAIGALADTRTVTYTFTSKDWAATCSQAGFGTNWTSKKGGGQLVSNQGIQVTQNNNDACANSPVAFTNVTKVTVKYATNASKGAGTIEMAKIATADAAVSSTREYSYTVSTSGGTTPRYANAFELDHYSGYLQIYVNCKTNSIYIHSIEIEYEEAPARDPYTVLLNAGNGTCDASVAETSAGAGVVLPAANPNASAGDWVFAGWATAPVSTTTDAPELLAAGSTYLPESDNTTLYAVYSMSVSEGGSSEISELATYAYSNPNGWTTGGSIGNSTGYTLLINKSGYIESPDLIDFNNITSVVAKVRTYGGDAYKTFDIETADGIVWGSGEAGSKTLADATVYKAENSAASGLSKLRLKTTCGTSANGVGVSEIHVYGYTGSVVTTYDSNPSGSVGPVRYDFVFSDFRDRAIEAEDMYEFVLPADAPEISYSSSNENVAVVEDNTIFAYSRGVATITASWNETEKWNAGSATFTVTVTTVDPVDFSFDGFADRNMLVDDTYEFTLPAGAPAIKYTTTDENVATVEGNTIMALGNGTAQITASWDAVPKQWNAGSATFTVTVTRKGVIEVEPATLTIPVEETAEFTYVYNGDGVVTVASDNTSVAKVSDNNGVVTVTAVGAGTANITISAPATETYTAAEATCAVTVKAGTQTFELVKKGDVIEEGDVVVFIANNNNGNPYSISATPNKKNGELAGVTEGIEKNEDGTISADPEKVAVFTVVKGTSNFALQYQSGEYLTLAGNSTTGFNSSSSVIDVANVKLTQGNQYFTAAFTQQSNRFIYGNGSAFRAYGSNNNSNVYLYRLAKAKKPATLAWNTEYAGYDLDFGWDGEMPVLTVDPEAAADAVKYTSYNTDVATVSYSADNGLKITPKAIGECIITAIIDPANKAYTSEEASFMLTVTGAEVPQFINPEGDVFTENSVKLYPSELKDGYTLTIKKTEGYDLNVTINPTGAGKVEYTESGATVTVNKECRITVRNKKDGVTSTRYTTFEVSTIELSPADISWTAARYVYDLATKQWNTTPELVNNHDLPVIYASNDESVATISQTGKVMPIAQGTTTISAKVEGTDDYSENTVTTTIRVTDSTAPVGYDIYEMVKKGDQLRENEQFIIVSGEPFNPEVGVGQQTAPGGRYYALTPYRVINNEVREYYEAVPVDLPEGDESGERLLVADDSNVLRLSKQYDTSATNPNYPYLFQVMNEDVDINGDGEICDTDNPTTSSGNNERIQGRYIQVQRAKLFSFVDLPENIEDRGMMNGNIQVLDPATIEGYTEKDYINLKRTAETSYSGTLGEFTDKGEIIFNGTDGHNYFVRFNPAANVHFNVYALDQTYKEDTRSKQSTFPVRIYRLANRVEKPSITVYPEEPVKSDIAFEEGVTFNNKVRVVIEQHPKTSADAKLMRQWQKEGRNPALPDYEAFNSDQVVVYVDGHVVVDEEDNVLRYLDPDFNTATAMRTLFAVANLEDVYSESASETFNFKVSAPRINRTATDAEGNLSVRISRPTNYTQDAVYYYVISDNDSKPEVVFNQDGTVSTSAGTLVEAWTGDNDDIETGIVTLPAGQTLWVGAFKAGYQPSVVQFTNNTVFPECRPMQLLRLTDAGRQVLLEGLDTAEIFDGKYDPTKPLYINYRNDLVNEDGTLADSDNHFHYMIQREHEYYTSAATRRVRIEQISENRFRKVFGDNNLNVDATHAKNFLWTSDFYVFTLNEADFNANFADPESVTHESPKVVAPDRTYTALVNTFNRRPTNADGTYVAGAQPEQVTYYGAMLENQGKLGAKELTTQIEYAVDGRTYNTEASATVSPRIPSTFGLTYEYQYGQDEEPTLKAENPDAEFVKLRVQSSIEGKDDSEVLIPIDDLNPRHLNLVFKFNRPNISKHILQNYDIFYTIKLNRLTESGEEGSAPTRVLLPGSGVYVDNEVDEENDDAVYRFRIDDVHPSSKIYPEIEISKVTYVGNTSAESYGQVPANFGSQTTVSAAPNNSERQDLTIEKLKIVKAATKEVDGQKYADWKYVSHKHLIDTPDIIVQNPDDTEAEPIRISSSYYHIETFVPGTDYHSSYEYLVKHDDNAHNAPADQDHPFYSDPVGGDYDALRHTIIARDVPMVDGTQLPHVVVAPVYFFAHTVDMNPVQIDEDNNKIDGSFADLGGSALIVKVQDLKSDATAAPAKAPRRVDGNGTEAPSNKEYPMPHAGDTDMNHSSILDLTNDPAYTAVKGGTFEPDDDNPVITGIEDIYAPGVNDGTVRYYNLQGIRVDNPEHGIYIRQQGNTTTKVVVK